MEKTLILLFLAISFLACNNPKHTVDQHQATNTENHDEHDSELALNNGAKWQADESTRNHASKLNNKIAEFNKMQNTAVADYQTFGNEVQKELNSLVSDCKMKGPDHDALHLWLEPVLQTTKELKGVDSEEQGKQTVQELTEQVEKFNQYFN
ncbi:MAG TPA: hypothetical protein VGD22_04680 [Sphingobacteriaceae bacterium]